MRDIVGPETVAVDGVCYVEHTTTNIHDGEMTIMMLVWEETILPPQKMR
jgi:hypothetical protein